jgi:kynurenine formamidase
MQIIDLSQTISAQMPRFSESAPQPRISAWMSHAQAAESGRYEGCSCEITEVAFVTSISTYIDSPYHFVPEGPAIHELSLDQCVLPAVCLDCPPLEENQLIEARFFENLDVSGKAVLICTGWSAFWGDERYARYPFIGRAAAEILRDGGAKLVGVDYLAIDNQSDPQRPVHTTLLRAGVLIVENLTGLEPLIGREFTFHAAPVKVQGAAAFPVRAYAVLD